MLGSGSAGERAGTRGADFASCGSSTRLPGKDLRTHEESECPRRSVTAGSERNVPAEEERQGRIRAEREIARLRAMLEHLPGAGARDVPIDGK